MDRQMSRISKIPREDWAAELTAAFAENYAAKQPYKDPHQVEQFMRMLEKAGIK